MVAKKTVMAAILAGCTMLLGGCEMLEELEPNKWEPQEADAISIDKDGSITEIIQEALDAAYYSAAELQSMINTEVQNYNSENGEGAVTLKTFEAVENKVKVEIEYASAKDYAQFNNVELYYGSLINAQLEGYLFDVTYQKVRDGVVKDSSVSGSEVIKEMDEEVLIVRAPLEVQVPGSVLYISSNAEMLASDVVLATGEQDDEEAEALVLPSNAVYKAEEGSFAEEIAANRVYIIFEME